MFQLIPVDEKNKRSGGDSILWVSWCLTAYEIGKIKIHLEKHPELKPFMLLTVGQLYKGENLYDEILGCRQIVDLSQGLACVNFRRPGKNTVLATIVFAKSIGQAKKRYTNTYNDYYSQKVLEEHENDEDRPDDPFFLKEIHDLEENWNFQQKLSFAILDAEVDVSLFAKKPRDIKWLNALIDAPLKDQCAVRKRRMFAYTLQPLAMGLMVCFITAVATIFGGILIIYGSRKVQWEYLIPFRDDFDPDEVTINCHLWDTVFFSNKKGKLRIAPFWMLSPVFIAATALVALVAKALPFIATDGWGEYFNLMFVIWASLTIVAGIAWLLHQFALSLEKLFKKIELKDSVDYAQMREEKTRAILREQINALSCETLTSNIPVVPHQSLRARVYVGLNTVKAAVCRPLPQ